MTESTFYVCDICGKAFETESECCEHEQKERYGSDIYEHVWAWDRNGKRLNLNDYGAIDTADYLLADSEQGRQFIDQFFHDEGYDRPYGNDETRGLNTLLYYNGSAYEWQSWERLLADVLHQRDQLQDYPLVKSEVGYVSDDRPDQTGVSDRL